MSEFKVKQSPCARMLAGALAGLLFLFALLSASAAVHQNLHHAGSDPSSCLLCLFAKGQVDAAQAEPVVPARACTLLLTPPRLERTAPQDVSFLISPSRAPPAVAAVRFILV